MDVLSTANNKSFLASEIKSQAYAHELSTIFNYYSDHISVLSLDCFDTLLWRKTALPMDVFHDLSLSPIARTSSEGFARLLNYIQKKNLEVSLEEVYQAAYPSLNLSGQNQFVEAEILAEKKACYPFLPVVDLIRQAHAKNIKVIIVSNTYLKQSQLRELLTAVLPCDVMDIISHIFCSCEFGKSKNNGLFVDVLEQLAVTPDKILHIGDNPSADLHPPKELRMHALHLLQFAPNIDELLRLQSIAAAIACPEVRYKRGLSHPFRGLYASQLASEKPESIIGYYSMGPIMYAFSAYIVNELNALKQSQKNVKVIFLLRDGYLLSKACETFAGHALGKALRISRFTATVVSFRSKQDIIRYLNDSISKLHFRYMCHQLLLSKDLAAKITEQAEKSDDPMRVFIETILQETIIQEILTQSNEYRKRWFKYLRNEIELQEDDTICFIDVGYSGTTQRLLTSVFKEELKVDVIGRYLISLDTPEWQTKKSGLFDPSWCDNRLLVNMICSSVALIEEICTGGGDTVVNYDEKGTPIFSKSNNSENQNLKTQRIHDECIRFIQDAKSFFQDSDIKVSSNELRDIALFELIRRIYLPTLSEIEFLQDFQHDLDKGTKASFQVFDIEKNFNSLRRQGLPFINFHPYEIRAASLDLAIMVMTQRRFGFDVGLNDLSLRREKITVMLMQDQRMQNEIIYAIPTYDGYFSLWIAVNAKTSQLAVLWGLNYLALQIESVELISAHAILRKNEAENSVEITADLKFNQMQHKYGKLYECASKQSALLYAPKISVNQDHFVRITYRPIEKL